MEGCTAWDILGPFDVNLEYISLSAFYIWCEWAGAQMWIVNAQVVSTLAWETGHALRRAEVYLPTLPVSGKAPWLSWALTAE